MKNFRLWFLMTFILASTACGQAPPKPAPSSINNSSSEGITGSAAPESAAERKAESAAGARLATAREAEPAAGARLATAREAEPVAAVRAAESTAPASAVAFAPAAAAEKNYAQVQVFYATDRKASGSTSPSKFYGSEHSDIAYGKCMVSIPNDHKTGELESPSIRKLELREDPKKHVVLLDVTKIDEKSHFTEIAKKVRLSKQKSAFIFIDGNSITFEDAARRTAQMASDLSFDGAPVFYNWPSQGNNAGNIADENTIDWTQSHLETFLYDFVSKTAANNIYLIAHSRTSPALTKALISLRKNPKFKNRFKEVILAAPDIDADIFKNQIAPALKIAEAQQTRQKMHRK